MDRPRSERRDPFEDRARRAELLAVVVTIAAGLGVIMGSAAWRRAPAVVAMTRSLAPDAPRKSLGEVAPGSTATVAFTLRNVTDRPIRVQGARSSCTCSMVEGIPGTIEAGDAREFRGVVRAGSEPGPFDGSFVLYTDDAREPEVRLGYTGRVVDISQ